MTEPRYAVTVTSDNRAERVEALRRPARLADSRPGESGPAGSGPAKRTGPASLASPGLDPLVWRHFEAPEKEMDFVRRLDQGPRGPLAPADLMAATGRAGA